MPRVSKPRPLGIASGNTSFLSNPRAPSAVRPLSRVSQDLPTRHATLNPRPPDLGGHAPVNGQRAYVGGRVGGLPAKPADLLEGAAKAQIARTNTATAGRLTLALKREVNAKRLALKQRTRVMLGKSGTWAAKVGPERIDPRTGIRLFRAGLRDTRPNLTRSQFAQDRVVPASFLNSAAFDRQRLALFGSAQPKTQVTPPDGLSPDDEALATLKRGGSVLVGKQEDYGVATVRPGPEQILTTGAFGAAESTERILFIVGVVVIGFFAFKGFK
jgi:hypothetical protein